MAIGGTFVYISSTQDDGRTALIYASENGHTECARVLLDGGADKEATDHVRDQKYIRAFMNSEAIHDQEL